MRHPHKYRVGDSINCNPTDILSFIHCLRYRFSRLKNFQPHYALILILRFFYIYILFSCRSFFQLISSQQIIVFQSNGKKSDKCSKRRLFSALVFYSLFSLQHADHSLVLHFTIGLLLTLLLPQPLDGKTQTNFSLVNLSICCAVHTHILYAPHSLRIHVITLFLLIVIIIGRVFLPFLCFSHFRRWPVRRLRIAQTPNASLLFAVRINKNNNNNNKTKLIL